MPKSETEKQSLLLTIGCDGHHLLSALYDPFSPEWLRQLKAIVTAAAMNVSRMWAFWRNIPIGLTRVSRFSAFFPSASS